MSEIKINISALEDAIVKMNALKDDWSARNTNAPATVGGGQAVNEFESLAKLYKTLNDNMVTLASNTAAFLTNVKDSYQASDQKAAAAIRGE